MEVGSVRECFEQCEQQPFFGVGFSGKFGCWCASTLAELGGATEIRKYARTPRKPILSFSLNSDELSCIA